MSAMSKLERAAHAAARLDDKYNPLGAEPDEAWLIPYAAGLVIGIARAQARPSEAEFDQALATACDYVTEAAQRLDERGG